MSVNPDNYIPNKKVINLLHYNRGNNTIVEPVTFETSGFETVIPVNVYNSVDLSIIGETNLRYTVFKNLYMFYIDSTIVDDTGQVQDVFFVDFPFNDAGGPAPFNPSGNPIMCGDTDFVLNGDFRAGTITIGTVGEITNILLIWPDKLLNGGGIMPANSEVTFGNSCFTVAFFNNNL